MNELALFAGAGGGILGGKLLGWRTVCAVEYEPHAAAILVQRQNDGILQSFPIWDDVRTFDGRPWMGIVDVVSGGFPCQDISTTSGGIRRGMGIEGKKSGLWSEMSRIISEVRSQYVFVENSPALTFRGLGRVLGDMAKMGYDAKWGVFSAGDVGARHRRERIWIVGFNRDAHKNSGVPVTGFYYPIEESIRTLSKRFLATPRMGRKNNGLAYQMDRLARIGNGQVPAVVRLAWGTLAKT